MFAYFRKRQLDQKKQMLEGVFAQNLKLVGKAPVERNSFFSSVNWYFRLAFLIFIGIFLSTDTRGSRVSHSNDMFSDMQRQSVPGADARLTGFDDAGNPLPAHFQLPSDKMQGYQNQNSLSQTPEDKKQVKELLNLISQSLEEKKQGQVNAAALDRNFEDKAHVQEYVNLISQSQIPIKKMFGLSVKTIIIDAGHGGDDPGAIGKLGVKEKDITMDIARTLKSRLEAGGAYRVLLSRQDDKFISLKARTVLANKSGADLFISIHVNFVPSPALDMVETYYFGPSKTDISMQLAEKENEGSDFSMSDYNQIIKKLSNTMKFQESRLFAQSIQHNLFKNMRAVSGDVMDHGVKRAPFVVLLGADMPGVLVEVACLSNREQEQRLRDPSYREDIAAYIEKGIIHYLDIRSTDHDTERADRDVERHAFRRN
jgi:N-acetylmuramoyl-L-alanine amidase